MRFFFLLILLTCTFMQQAVAAEAAFSVTPSECIAAEQGDVCVMSVALSYPKLTEGNYCLTLDDDTLIGCWSHSELPDSLKLKLTQESVLSLVRDNSTFHTSVILTLRYRSASMLRRRVRNPWSLF